MSDTKTPEQKAAFRKEVERLSAESPFVLTEKASGEAHDYSFDATSEIHVKGKLPAYAERAAVTILKKAYQEKIKKP